MDHANTSSSSIHYLQQATDASTPQVGDIAGCWKLAPGRAMTLRASQTGELRIAYGRVWVTFDNAGQDSKVRAGDYFLNKGERLQLLPGQALVMESFAGKQAAAPVYFSWDPVFAAVAVKAPVGVAQPLIDLRMALGLVVGAVGRLTRGLLGGLAGGVRVATSRFQH